MKPFIFTLLIAANASTLCHADEFFYVDWTEAAPDAGTARGIIELPDMSTVSIDFEVLNADETPGTYFFAQTDDGTNYWEPDAPYISDEVSNPPPTTDILALVGGETQTYRISLSEPIEDPIMAIVSLGAPGTTVEYDFDRPFEIVSQGQGFWGGSNTSLSQLEGDVLSGREGHGTIRFTGTFDSFSWTVAQTEGWHGFTYGIRTTTALIPEPGGFILLLAALFISVGRWRRRRSTVICE